jgi:hypothetical protein
VRGVRLVLSALSDTLEHLMTFTTASLLWWLAVFTVVFAPGATVALFLAADPRVTSELDQPTLRDRWKIAKSANGNGWRLALVCLPIIAVLLWNLRFYGIGDHQLGVLAPFWIVLLLAAMSITTTAFSLAALLGEAWAAALRQAARQTGARLPTVLAMSALLWPLLALGGLLVVPIFMFLPATVAAAVNRLVLDTRNLAVPNPLAPTQERAVEEAIGRDRRRFGP